MELKRITGIHRYRFRPLLIVLNGIETSEFTRTAPVNTAAFNRTKWN